MRLSAQQCAIIRNGIEFAKSLQQKNRIDNDIGISTTSTYTIKKIDLDYFDID
jgi:restriction endonuclease Mrr